MIRLIEPMRAWARRRDTRKQHRRWERHRAHALFRASNGEHLTRLEREQFDLPDWTS